MCQRCIDLERRVARLERLLDRKRPKQQRYPKIAQAILRLMSDGESRKTSQIAALTGYIAAHVSAELNVLARAGEITKIKRGLYRQKQER